MKIIALKCLIILFVINVQGSVAAMTKIGYLSPVYMPMEISISGEFIVSTPKRARVSVLENVKGKYKRIRNFECVKCKAGFSGSDYFYVISNIDSKSSTLDFYKLSDISSIRPSASYDIVNVHEVGDLNGFLFVKSDSGVQQFVGKDKKEFCSSSHFRKDMEIIGIDKKFTRFALKNKNSSILVGCDEKLVDIFSDAKLIIFGENLFSVISKSGLLYLYSYENKELCYWDFKRLVNVVGGEFNKDDELILYGKSNGYLLENTGSTYSIFDFNYEDYMPDKEIYKEMYAGPSNQYGRINLAHRYGYIFTFDASNAALKEINNNIVCE